MLRGVTFSIGPGERLGLLGPSGEGKSTLARLLLGLERPDRGELLIEGRPASEWRRENRGAMSVVFQDYAGSVDPRWSAGRIAGEPLAIQGLPWKERIPGLFRSAGLDPALAERYPHELSGGELQRVCIARALSASPRFILLDEAASSLDAVSQSEILDLIGRAAPQAALLFISHDIEAAASFCQRLLFLHRGVIAESLETTRLSDAKSPFARSLLASVLPFQPS